jgi:hypothetical protein
VTGTVGRPPFRALKRPSRAQVQRALQISLLGYIDFLRGHSDAELESICDVMVCEEVRPPARPPPAPLHTDRERLRRQLN